MDDIISKAKGCGFVCGYLCGYECAVVVMGIDKVVFVCPCVDTDMCVHVWVWVWV